MASLDSEPLRYSETHLGGTVIISVHISQTKYEFVCWDFIEVYVSLNNIEGIA